MILFQKFKTFLMDKFVIIKDLKSTKKEIRDIKFMLSIMMDHYWESAENARPAVGAVRQQQLARLEIMQDLVSVLDSSNIKYWLDNGTLLGSVRHKGFIPWDDDADIGLLYTDKDAIINVVKDKFKDEYSIYYTGEYDKYLKFEKYFGINRVSIDLFLYKNDNGKMYTKCFPKGLVYNKPFPEKIIFPLKTLVFEGVEFYVPNNYDLYLKKNYGEYHSLPKKEHFCSHEKWNSYIDFYPDEKTK